MRRAEVLSWILAFALAAVAPVARAEDCTLQRLASVDMTIMPDGRIGIPVKIADRSLLLLLDTGSPFSLLSSAAIDQLRLKRQAIGGGSYLMFAGGRKVTERTTVPTLEIGALQGRNLTLGALPPNFGLNGVDGILGIDILTTKDFELDFASSQLRFYAKDHCEGQVVYWTREAYAVTPFATGKYHHLHVRAELDGKSVDVILDTGASRSMMSLEKAKRLFRFEETALRPVPEAGVPAFAYPFEKLSFEGIEVRHPDITLLPDKQIGVSGLSQLILGTTVLRGLHIYVAVQEKKLYLTAASAR